MYRISFIVVRKNGVRIPAFHCDINPSLVRVMVSKTQFGLEFAQNPNVRGMIWRS
jgi:hypothetical protein